MVDSDFVGQNLSASDSTTIFVKGNITYSPLYAFATLNNPIISAESSLPTIWDSVFDYAINPNNLSALQSLDINSSSVQTGIGDNGGLAGYLTKLNYLLFPSSSQASFSGNPGFVYDPTSLQLGFKGVLASSLLSILNAAMQNGYITVLVTDTKGNPIVNADGTLETAPYTFSAATWGSAINQLYNSSQNDINPSSLELGMQIGGPGTFNVTANGNINLGNSQGIISAGYGGYGLPGSPNYAPLQEITGPPGSGGAAVNVTSVNGSIQLITSAISSLDGGDVDVSAPDGSISLSQGTFVFPVSTCYGIWTSGHSSVNVTAQGDIDIGSSRIATFDGGNVNVESEDGSINCGFGANIALDVPGAYLNNGVPSFGEFGELDNIEALLANPAPYGSGILAEYPTLKFQTAGATGPGNITVTADDGNIVSVLGGISQFALNATIGGGPTVTLIAKGGPTPDQGNIILGDGGVIGGTINVNASGNVQGLILSQQNTTINAGQSFTGEVLAGGSANFTGSGTVGGLVVGIGGINVSGGGTVTATLLSQNVSGPGGVTQNTLGASAATSATSQAAAQQASQKTTQVADNNSGNDDDQKKKKKATIHVGHVTVILSSAVPR
jgi:hypothetical protein